MIFNIHSSRLLGKKLIHFAPVIRAGKDTWNGICWGTNMHFLCNFTCQKPLGLANSNFSKIRSRGKMWFLLESLPTNFLFQNVHYHRRNTTQLYSSVLPNRWQHHFCVQRMWRYLNYSPFLCWHGILLSVLYLPKNPTILIRPVHQHLLMTSVQHLVVVHHYILWKKSQPTKKTAYEKPQILNKNFFFLIKKSPSHHFFFASF